LEKEIIIIFLFLFLGLFPLRETDHSPEMPREMAYRFPEWGSDFSSVILCHPRPFLCHPAVSQDKTPSVRRACSPEEHLEDRRACAPGEHLGPHGACSPGEHLGDNKTTSQHFATLTPLRGQFAATYATSRPLRGHFATPPLSPSDSRYEMHYIAATGLSEISIDIEGICSSSAVFGNAAPSLVALIKNGRFNLANFLSSQREG